MVNRTTVIGSIGVGCVSNLIVYIASAITPNVTKIYPMSNLMRNGSSKVVWHTEIEIIVHIIIITAKILWARYYAIIG